MDKREIERIKKNVKKIFEDQAVHSVILFGSHAIGEGTKRSDIDICIVAPKLRESRKEAFKKLLELGAKLPQRYDLHIFELLPLHMKIEVIRKGIILWTRNKLDLHEYFYLYRKIWRDQERRQKLGEDIKEIFV